MMVRVVNWAGPCLDKGPLVRETANFFVYSSAGKERRIGKQSSLAHLTPCERCMDHPKTLYPRGFDL